MPYVATLLVCANQKGSGDVPRTIGAMRMGGDLNATYNLVWGQSAV